MGTPEKKEFFYSFSSRESLQGGDTWRVYYDEKCVKSVALIMLFIVIGAIMTVASILIIFHGGEPKTPLNKRFIIGIPLTYISSHITFAGIVSLNRIKRDGIGGK